MTLLLADDELNELNALSRFFKENYADSIVVVATCHNGLEAVEKGIELKPDIAILDIQMPVHDGLEVARVLREKDPGIAIVMLTAYSLFDYAKEAISIGVKDYILKPYDTAELRRVMDGIVSNSRNDLKSELKNIVSHLSSASEGSAESHPVVRLAMKYLHENYMNRISLNMMADDLGYSASYISKCLVKYLGENFNDLLLAIRCDEAVKLLAKGNMRVNEVAYAVGFSDPNYFNKCFKTVMGKSPKKYFNTLAGNVSD